MSVPQEETDFEGLDAGAPVLAHMTAGALAGITEHCLMFPVDTIKTRRQVAAPLATAHTPCKPACQAARAQGSSTVTCSSSLSLTSSNTPAHPRPSLRTVRAPPPFTSSPGASASGSGSGSGSGAGAGPGGPPPSASSASFASSRLTSSLAASTSTSTSATLSHLAKMGNIVHGSSSVSTAYEALPTWGSHATPPPLRRRPAIPLAAVPRTVPSTFPSAAAVVPPRIALTLPVEVGNLPQPSVTRILREQGPKGVLRLYRGVGAAAMGAGPAHAMYFSVYEAAKGALGVAESDDSAHPLQAAAASGVATIISDGAMVPADVIKQRLQLCNSPYKGGWDCARHVLRSEGVRGFYRSYTTTLAMNLPFATINFGVYDALKAGISAQVGDKAYVSSAMVHLVAGGLAGGAAAAATTPLDVIKTRLQTDAIKRPPLLVARTLLEEGGIAALFSGAAPRILFHVPAVGICWVTYEGFKSFLLPYFT